MTRAEAFFRRLLGRLGGKVDHLMAADRSRLSPRAVGALIARLEEAVEANLDADRSGVRRVAPNHFEVLFTYEDSNDLDARYYKTLAEELRAALYEYINNRRYETRGPINVKTGQDLFAKSTVVKASFQGGDSRDLRAAPAPGPVRTATVGRVVRLRGEDGGSYQVELRPGGTPVDIGRAAGCAVRIEDASISRRHCSLAVRANGEIIVADLGSANGTAVNGRRVGDAEARAVQSGDQLTVGDVHLTVVSIE